MVDGRSKSLDVSQARDSSSEGRQWRWRGREIRDLPVGGNRGDVASAGRGGRGGGCKMADCFWMPCRTSE